MKIFHEKIKVQKKKDEGIAQRNKITELKDEGIIKTRC
jgi:hypothetical protein